MKLIKTLIMLVSLLVAIHYSNEYNKLKKTMKKKDQDLCTLARYLYRMEAMAIQEGYLQSRLRAIPDA